MKFSSKIEKCGQSPIRKFYPLAEKAIKDGKNVYYLNIGQPDVATPQPFFDAIKNFSEKTVSYAPSNGMPGLISSIIDYYKSLNIIFESKDVLITTGGSEALTIVFNCILDNGDEILIPEPFYSNYNAMAFLAGAKVCPLKTDPNNHYRYAVREEIESKINEHTKAILITNPNNPTGTVLTHKEMQMLVDICKKNNLYLIADEAYREFVYDGQQLESFASFTDAKENIIVCDTVSKRFSACGARVGCILSRNNQLIAHALKQCQTRLSVATLEQIASQRLYEEGTEYFNSVREEYKRRRDTVIDALKKIPGVKAQTPDGAFYLMATLPIDDTDKFQEWLLTEFDDHGDTVMYAPGEPFYATPGKGRNEIRIAYVTECKKLERAIELIGLGLKEYKGLLK